MELMPNLVLNIAYTFNIIFYKTVFQTLFFLVLFIFYNQWSNSFITMVVYKMHNIYATFYWPVDEGGVEVGRVLTAVDIEQNEVEVSLYEVDTQLLPESRPSLTCFCVLLTQLFLILNLDV